MAYVYRHIRLDKNEVFYIGIGSDGSYKRAFSKKYRNRHWRFIVDQTDYEIEIMMDDLTWEQAQEKEREFICLYGRRDLDKGTLVNMTDGGDGLHNPSLELREKYSKLYTGTTVDEARRNKISEGMRKSEAVKKINKGRVPWNKGKPRDEETKRKIAEKLTGTSLSEETKKKMSETRKGVKKKPVSDETRKKMSESRKGRIPWNKGIPWSDEVKSNISQGKLKQHGKL